MSDEALQSIPHVADVTIMRGNAAPSDAVADLLLEMPHGATREADFDALVAALRGTYPHNLRDFFFVNTDVGSGELGARLAERVIEGDPRRTVMTIRSRIPRTFVDCNRILNSAPSGASEAASPSVSPSVTPGLPPYVHDDRDRVLLLARHAAYTDLVSDAMEHVCGSGGTALMLHTYAPRSVDVEVDEHIVESLHAAYASKTVATWPLRHEVDLITRDGDSRLLADPALLACVRTAFAALDIDPAENGTYYLHPATTAAVLAARYPGRTLCLEVRRDLLVPAFTPFAEMDVDRKQVDRFAGVLETALRTHRRDTPTY